MKTSILIAGVCLLALTSTITEALDKKQVIDCVTPSSAVQSCLAQVASQNTAVCSGSCRDTLLQHFSDCGAPRAAFDLLCDAIDDGGDNDGDNDGGDNDGGDNDGRDNDGGDNDGGDNDGGDNDGGDNDGGDNDGGGNDGGDNSAATVGVTLFTIVSAVLAAVGN